MEALQTNTRISLHNILVATDFSKPSTAALPFAISLAQQYGAKVFVAHALGPEPHLAVPLEPIPVSDDLVWLDAKRNLAKFVPKGSAGNPPCEAILRRGDFWGVISNVIWENKIDLVVSGTHGRQGLKKLVLGSDAEKIYRRATCPVLSVGPRVLPMKNAGWKLKQILFPTDGSEDSLKALPYALSFAEENQADLILVQFIPLTPPEYRESFEASVKEKLLRLLPPEADAWCKLEFMVRFEFPAEGILRLATERRANLIVMGVKRSAEAAVSTHLPWTVASQVIAAAPCPVLTVRGH
jgi:nucleotide-binding universal stress UspA family protein